MQLKVTGHLTDKMGQCTNYNSKEFRFCTTASQANVKQNLS